MLLFFLFFLVVLSKAFADHKTANRFELQYWGFKSSAATKIIKTSLKTRIGYEQHSLPFPVALTKAPDQFGALMHQFQDFTTPAYYHAGLDIRTDAEQIVIAPISGKIEGGYYAYLDHASGKSEKQFLPLKEALQGKGAPPWGKRYFEIAIVDPQGYRFEFHHINPDTLSASIIDKILNQENVRKGDVIGSVIANTKLLGIDYHHLHYNIIHSDGYYINPLFVSYVIEDTSPPQIENVYAAQKSGCGKDYPFLVEMHDSKAEKADGYIILQTSDTISKSRFSNPPTIVIAQFGKNTFFEWDFSKSLTDSNGLLPILSELYLKNYCDTFGESKASTTLKTASTKFKFYIKIPVPLFYNGPVKLTVIDMFGNKTQRTVAIKAEAI